MKKVDRAEIIFFSILALAAGMILGAVLFEIANMPKQLNCNDGVTETFENGYKLKTYIPANDTCRRKK